MVSKEQRKLRKRKAKEDQKKKNLLRKRTIAQQVRKQEKLVAIANRQAEKAENRANAAALKEIQEQRSLEQGVKPMSAKVKDLTTKIELAKDSYKKVEGKLTMTQKEQVLKNIRVLEDLLNEYQEAVGHRTAVNKELEGKGATTFEEKMNLLAKEAKEKFGDGCVDQIVCSKGNEETSPISGSAQCLFKANP